MSDVRDWIAAIEHSSWPGDTASFWGEASHLLAWQAFEGDVNAAIRLVGKVLPGWEWCIDPRSALVEAPALVDALSAPPALYGHSDVPARSLLIAILRALEP